LSRLVSAFYKSIRDGSASPISSDLALRVSRAEDVVLAKFGKTHVDTSVRASSQSNCAQREHVLVTGASGHLGRQVVDLLAAKGYRVRVFVRPFSHIEHFER